MVRKKKNIDRKLRLVKAIIAIIVLFILLGTIFSFIKSSRWDGQRRFTIIVASQIEADKVENSPLVLFSIEPRTNRALLLTIVPETILEVPFGYGEYKAASVFHLGELDKTGNGGYLLKKTIEETLSIAADGYVISNNLSYLSKIHTYEDVRGIKSKYFTYSSLLFKLPQIFTNYNRVKSDIAFYDQLKLVLAIASLRTDQIEFLPLTGERLVKSQILADGTEVKAINYEIVDSFLADRFQDKLIREEEVTIEVVNSTGATGEANNFTRILTHLGADVIFKSSQDRQLSSSCIILLADRSFSSSEIVKRMKLIYNCELSGTQEEVIHSDIKIILGRDFIR